MPAVELHGDLDQKQREAWLWIWLASGKRLHDTMEKWKNTTLFMGRSNYNMGLIGIYRLFMTVNDGYNNG